MNIEQVKKLSDGFKGEFQFQPAHVEDHGVGLVGDFVDIEDRLIYVSCDGDDTITISDTLDPDVAEALAALLNSVPDLLAEIERLRHQLERR